MTTIIFKNDTMYFYPEYFYFGYFYKDQSIYKFIKFIKKLIIYQYDCIKIIKNIIPKINIIINNEHKT